MSFLASIIAMFLHELGHVAAALVLGVKCHRIGWCRFGMFAAIDMPENRAAYYCVTLAGPLASLALFLMACVFGWYSFALTNALIILTGLLPGGDFWRLFQFRLLRRRAMVRIRLSECGRA